MEKVFGQEGLIASYLKGYEYRPGQVGMAEAVLRAFEEKRHLIVEAGTGTGKTLAYLVPAIAAALGKGQRVIISTGTKNLQEQLMQQDIPFLQRILPKKFSATCLKGRGNYACLHRIKKAETMPILEGMGDLDHFDKVRSWVGETETGDRAELIDLPDNLRFWNQISARSETCLGQKCADYEACFITQARQKAEKADIIIVNHHLFFADLNLRDGEYGKVLPDYAAVIFDEAHLVEDIAADYFGFEVSSYQVEEVIRDATNVQIEDRVANQDVIKACGKIGSLAERFWSGFRTGRGEEGRFPIDSEMFARIDGNGEVEATSLGEFYFGLDTSLRQLEATLDALKDQTTEVESAVRRIRQIRFDLDFIVKAGEKTFVYWLERRARGLFLRATPIDVSGILEDKLFDKMDTVVLTSATLSSGGKFDFVRDRLGLPREKTNTFIANSSFDFAQQTVLYLPPRMPDPRAPEYVQVAAGEIIKLLNVTQGRAFVLSTSLFSMNALYKLVRDKVDFPCLLQGEMSKAGLLEKFKKTDNAVLFATSSFWQGVDVRGEQLSCVIIDKLPFAVPTDPIVAARQKFIDENGGGSFYEYSIPQAIITLKQGIGRLIRSTTDKGVLAILDPRLRTKAYGKVFLDSLPKSKVTSDLKDVMSIFK
ncbi:MAG TPA: ATP-dependent DNA helicase [Pyrinomonadaceae bacterium]|nr:ATP-dependent DNA helicase [Pyrinomonadaceae bacterium]